MIKSDVLPTADLGSAGFQPANSTLWPADAPATMSALPAQPRTIPMPSKQCWRELRIRVLPLIVFGCTVAVVLVLWRRYVLGQ